MRLRFGAGGLGDCQEVLELARSGSVKALGQIRHDRNTGPPNLIAKPEVLGEPTSQTSRIHLGSEPASSLPHGEVLEPRDPVIAEIKRGAGPQHYPETAPPLEILAVPSDSEPRTPNPEPRLQNPELSTPNPALRSPLHLFERLIHLPRRLPARVPLLGQRLENDRRQGTGHIRIQRARIIGGIGELSRDYRGDVGP